MKQVNTGGPALPMPANEYAMHGPAWGITMRDYFVAQAMTSYLMPAGAGQTWAQRSDFDYIAETAYLAADAMLRAREAT